MPWGNDDWLVNRKIRQEWMRSRALAGLTEQILRTPANASEALACVLDEVLGEASPSSSFQVDETLAQDLVSGGEWVRGGLAAARTRAVSFQSLVLVLSDSAPYWLELVLVDAPVQVETEWLDSITWRFDDHFRTKVLDALLPSFSGLPASVESAADYVVPIAYAAFLLRDVLRTIDASDRADVREALVIYEGGDSVGVPIA